MQCTLEITVLSAEDLRIQGRPVSRDSFVLVSVDGATVGSTKQDHDGGNNPQWNETLFVPLPEKPSAAPFPYLSVEVRCTSRAGSSRVVGTAKLPISDVVAGYAPAHLVHFLSYRLRERNGEKNGIVNLAVKMVGLAGGRWPG